MTLAFFLDFLKTTSLTTYSYDRNGSIISEEEEGRKSEYRYDLLNRQTYVKTLDGKEQENFYDGEGLRAGLTENGKKTTFLFHNGEILTECEGGESAPIRRYVRGLGLSHVQTEDGVYHAYYQDEQGSTAYITGNNGNVENCYLYDSFGNVMESRESIANRILYTGQQYDQETGQYYLRARYYNPVIGRFTQEDTYRGDGLNLYAYCGNNPVMYYDPNGHAGIGDCPPPNQAAHDTTLAEGIEGGSNSITPVDVYSFGNKTEPRGARPQQDFNVESFDDIVGPESGPLPKGASNVTDINNSPLKGHYHLLPAGTQMPNGLDIIADGIDVIPNSPHGAGHYTIFPTEAMTVSKFNELYKSLPWQYGGKK